MAFNIFITSIAKRSVKKLPKEIKKEIVKLCNDYIAKYPFDSEKLQKPLNDCRSFHFKINNVYYRIAYKIIKDEKRIDIILIGTRENFYKRLKMVIK